MELLSRTCKTEQMNVQRLFARLFVIAGGLLWVFMAWGTEWAYRGSPFTRAAGSAALYALGIAVVFVIGLFYEYVAAAVLAVGVLAIGVFGIVAGWETGVWAIAVFFFIVPMLLAAALYFMAAHMQDVCTSSQ